MARAPDALLLDSLQLNSGVRWHADTIHRAGGALTWYLGTTPLALQLFDGLRKSCYNDHNTILVIGHGA